VFGKKVADVLLANRAQHCVADGVHQRVGVRMAVEAARMRNLHAAEDELAPGDQLMNVITDANVNHAPTVKFFRASKKKFPEFLAADVGKYFIRRLHRFSRI